MKKIISVLLVAAMTVSMAACGKGNTQGNANQETGTEQSSGTTTLVYGSGDYTRINPAMDEHVPSGRGREMARWRTFYRK